MKARLAIYKDGKLTTAYPLPEPGATIGRDADNFIKLEDTMVSRYHAEVHAKDDMWVLKDLNSTNGIFVNGSRVKNAVLKPQDKVRIGPFEMVFESIPLAQEWFPPHVVNPSPNARRTTLMEDLGGTGPDTTPGRPRS
ncbi:MAG: FHA domain-containing protein [Elusimicrobiota bacterium]